MKYAVAIVMLLASVPMLKFARDFGAPANEAWLFLSAAIIFTSHCLLRLWRNGGLKLIASGGSKARLKLAFAEVVRDFARSTLVAFLVAPFMAAFIVSAELNAIGFILILFFFCTLVGSGLPIIVFCSAVKAREKRLYSPGS